MIGTVVLLLLGTAAPLTQQQERQPAPQVAIGSVSVVVGSPAPSVLVALSRYFEVVEIEGGVTIHSRRGGEGLPSMVTVGIRDGRVRGFILTWAPGTAQPSAHELSRRLALATLGLRGCEMDNAFRSVDGEDVSSLRFQCGSYAVAFVTSDTKGVRTASLSVRIDP
jgi:hypothetical protein